MNAQTIIQKLNLKPHPEGGFYSETFRSEKDVKVDGGGEKRAGTAIYFLLEGDEKSHFHKITSDELWFFHQGETVEVVVIVEREVRTIILGNDVDNGERPQAIMPANTWFAAKIRSSKGYALVSCTVAPAFDFADFQLARREDLIQQYPDLTDIITEFT